MSETTAKFAAAGHGRFIRACRVMLPLLAFAVLVAGCQSPKQQALGPVLPEHLAAETPVTMGPGDVVKLTFPGAPEFNQSQKIRADGMISLPLVGEVRAGGKRLKDFQDELAHLYESQLKNKEVNVAIENSAVPVYVAGAVNHPGKILLERPMTAFEAIMEAGGFTAGVGNAKKVMLVRLENGRHTTQVLDLSPSLRGQPTNAFYLRAYDVIYVQENVF